MPSQLGFRKRGYIQVFDANHIMLFDRTGRELMEEVVALVACPGVAPGKSLPGLLIVLTLRFFLFGFGLIEPTTDFTMLSAQLLLGLAIEPGSFDFLSRREGGKIIQAQIDPDRVVNRGRLDVRHLEVTNKSYIPVSCGFL